MIALPGLTLATGRASVAAEILRTFARHIDRGMLPNRFPDQGEPAEYNSVDAALWYFHALACYLDETDDIDLLRELFPALKEIIDWHERGTRFGIRVDPVDGLLRAGLPGASLTWMDAKVGDWVVTPRIGKPVEINALWHFALIQMTHWSRAVGEPQTAGRYGQAAEAAARAFRERFWNEEGRYLFDVIDTPEGGGVDPSLRPNQIFAVSLDSNLLTSTQARAVVESCARELFTPVGLRSLASGDARYVARYEGSPQARDGAYHQGTVWSWLLGPFALAHYRVFESAERALELLSGIAAHLDELCLGSVSEIFDGASPHHPRGCFAQAWSVGEVLRAWHALSRARASARWRVSRTAGTRDALSDR
jgi:predicted glycogen debranching enzyme